MVRTNDTANYAHLPPKYSPTPEKIWTLRAPYRMGISQAVGILIVELEARMGYG